MIDSLDVIADMQKLVIAKAMRDPAFKAQLAANPRGAVESHFKITLPANIKVELQTAPPNTIQVVLPHVVAADADGELSDDSLEAVAGGSKSDPIGIEDRLNDELQHPEKYH